MNNKIIIFLVIAGILVLGGYLFYTSSPVVAAQGISTLKVTPDKVSIYFSVEARDKTLQLAQNKQVEISDALFIELVRLGFERSEIQTLSLNMYPEYDWSNNQQTQKGYVVSQQVIVVTDDFDKIAQIVDVAVSSGALVSSVSFELSDEKQNEYKTKALEQASMDAMKKAEATAKGAGKSLGRLVALESQNFDYYPYPIYSRAEGSTASFDK